MRNFNNSYKLLAGFLALVLVAGMASPAFAVEETFVEPPDIVFDIEATLEGFDDIVFDNGGVPKLGGGLNINIVDDVGPLTSAEDFTIDEDTLVTDFHFVLDEFDVPLDVDIEYYIFADGIGGPGDILASGVSQNLERDPINSLSAEVWFDLEEPFFAEAGVKYWFGIHVPSEATYTWDSSDEGEGISCQTNVLPPVFDDCSSAHSWFLLSGGNADKPIGGTVGSLDTMTLLVAGAQANMGLWSLALVGIVGAGVAITYKLKSKKTEQ